MVLFGRKLYKTNCISSCGNETIMWRLKYHYANIKPLNVLVYVIHSIKRVIPMRCELLAYNPT